MLLLFAGTDPAESDELRQIAQTVIERVGDLVTPYFIVPDTQRATETYGGILLRDDGAQLHERYDATVPSLSLLRPDDYVGFRSQPARQVHS
ncbi:hypothetical protein [Halocatena marina]|uniref:Uncharacterized protein n=1 Tax=Halocatena marina TaxID=2934937 RepID=A0ABD5YPZ3_9EURY|nr:hypothetical protein [Halocatena marina]